MDETAGLRERKKAETRTALTQSALRLAVELGADAVTAEAIARDANVSVRTFHNYFATKEEAFLAPFRTLLDHAAEELQARPVGEPVLDSLEQVWMRLASGQRAVPEDTLAQVGQLWTSPAMIAYQHRLVAEAVQRIVGPVAERTGTDPVRDLYPTLVTTTAIVALFTAMDHCPTEITDPADKAIVVHEAFAILRSGFQPPG
ncbi:MAG: TetR family transcriptional regulator [Chloroflexi bacterium]|nr:TetR family transcriptional regulator [Chloroflexota bacterium]